MKIEGLGVHIKVADIEKSRRFYESLGFKAVFGYGDEAWRKSLPEDVGSAPERYRGLTFKISDSASLEIAEGHIAVKDAAVFKETVRSPKVSAMVRVASLEPLFSNPEVKLNYPVCHYYWDTIEAAFRDPDGFVLVFIAPFSEAELERVKQYTEVKEVLA